MNAHIILIMLPKILNIIIIIVNILFPDSHSNKIIHDLLLYCNIIDASI